MWTNRKLWYALMFYWGCLVVALGLTYWEVHVALTPFLAHIRDTALQLMPGAIATGVLLVCVEIYESWRGHV